MLAACDEREEAAEPVAPAAAELRLLAEEERPASSEDAREPMLLKTEDATDATEEAVLEADADPEAAADEPLVLD
jgi:hypothetical protein